MYNIPAPKKPKYNLSFLYILLFIMFLIMILLAIEKNISNLAPIILFIIGGTFTLIFTIVKNMNKETYLYERLQEHGVLVKGVKCTCEKRMINEYLTFTFKVKVKGPDGHVITLERRLKDNEKFTELREMDLLIDPDNFKNYILEPSIERIK